MKRHRLANSELEISRLGLGCMSMSDVYGKADRRESLATIRRARELGINFFDSADVYGFGGNEEILAEAFAGIRSEVVIATKFGIQHDDKGITGLCGKPDYVHSCCEASLKRLQTDVIDLYYLHRPDPDTSIEDTVGAMAELVAEGKIRYLGLSEVSGEQLRRAHAIHPITAVQSEYSLWCPDFEQNCLPVMRELGVAAVPYSPLGRGFLTGSIRSEDDLPEADFRRSVPRFQGENLAHNLKIVAGIEAVAATHSATPAQVALAWLLHQGEDMFPIPGTKSRSRLEENAQATELTLSQAELNSLRELADQAVGARYGSQAALIRPASDRED